MAVTTLRPDGLGPFHSVGNWTLVGGSTFYGVMSDNNDGSYASRPDANPPSSTPEVTFSDFTLPAGTTLIGVIPRVRWRTPWATTIYCRVDFQMPNGTATTGILRHRPAEPFSASNTWFTESWSSGLITQRSDNTPLTVSDVNGSVAYIRSDSGFSATHYAFDVAELYLDVYYNEPPVASSITITNTEIPTPTVLWTYSDSDGDAQTAYQVRIFSEAQYTVGGFDPETSALTWSSGAVSGAGTSQVIGTSLTPGPYRAYVKVSDLYSYGAWTYNSFMAGLQGTATLTGVGDISAPATLLAEATATQTGTGDLLAAGYNVVQVDSGVTASGSGDLVAVAEAPICIVAGWGGGSWGELAFGGDGICSKNVDSQDSPLSHPKSNVRDLCIEWC